MSKQSNTTPAPYCDRVCRLRAEMTRRRLDGYLIQNRMDQYWLTGFTGEDGFVLVTTRTVVLLTDGRFDEAADIETPWARKVLRKIRTPERTAKALKPYKLKRVGFDPGHLNVAEFTSLRKHLKPTRLASARGVILDMRLQKDEGEVAAIRRAIRVAEKAFTKVAKWIKPGITERQIAARLGYEIQCLGAQEVAFPTIVAAGANASLPHYEPGGAVVKKGEGILIDWGARVSWYLSDLTRMVWPGGIPREIKRIQRVVKDAHDRAIACVKPGVKTSAVDRAARRVIEKAGYGSQFSHATGHGIGLDVHEAPRVGKETDVLLKPGMVITIEPGIYLPGKGGVRLEDDVLVTETGYEVLSTLPC
ncbi:MAG: M24 family metallopeptidase [Phycisphaerae bacterium]